MGPLLLLAGVVLFATAAMQAADALGRIRLRSYPFVRSESAALKWAYVSWLVIGGLVAFVFGFTVG
jgi:hypothetical protein